MRSLWRDRAWSIQGESGAALTVRDLTTGLTIMTLNAWGVPSGDGRRVITRTCQPNQMSVDALAVPSGDRLVGQVIQGQCASDNITASSSGDAILYSVDGSGELHRVELATGAHASIRAHDDAPSANGGSNLAIKLSSTERAVATVGRDALLRLWSYPGLERLTADIPTAWTRAYVNCYCALRTFAPLAWSSDDVLLATADVEGNTVVRRACDGAILTTLPGPTQTLHTQYDGLGKWRPVFLAFGPRDETLAVYYEGSLALYRVHRGP